MLLYLKRIISVPIWCYVVISIKYNCVCVSFCFYISLCSYMDRNFYTTKELYHRKAVVRKQQRDDNQEDMYRLSTTRWSNLHIKFNDCIIVILESKQNIAKFRSCIVIPWCNEAMFLILSLLLLHLYICKYRNCKYLITFDSIYLFNCTHLY